MTFSSLSRFKCLGLVVSLALMVNPVVSFAQQKPAAQPSEKGSEDLGKLQPFVDAKNWNQAINLLNGILRYASPNSYDEAFANDILSKIYLQKGDYADSIPPLERAYVLGATYEYFEPRSQLDRLYYLAQLYYQEATSSKVPAVQTLNYTKASTYIEIWLQQNPKPTQDGRLFYASLLYNRALLIPNTPDNELLNKAQEQVNEALVTTLNPKEGFYLILLATLQQQGKIKEATEIFELLVQRYPSKTSYWQQLMGTYSNLAVDAKSPDETYEYNIRSIVTIERAQALGFMTTPKDNYNLVGIYFNIGQFGKATELLHQGLRDGSIESDIKKWELLAYSFQQVNQEFKAIEVLKEAGQIFPTSGQLDNQIAQIYYSLNKTEDAYRHLNIAIAKGNIDKLGSLYYFKAYICFELLKFEEALVAIDKAANYDDLQDSQLPRLRLAIVEAIAERENALKQTEDKKTAPVAATAQDSDSN